MLLLLVNDSCMNFSRISETVIRSWAATHITRCVRQSDSLYV